MGSIAPASIRVFKSNFVKTHIIRYSTKVRSKIDRALGFVGIIESSAFTISATAIAGATLITGKAFAVGQASNVSATAMRVGMKMDVWDLIWHSGVIVKFVLLILFLFSVFSWAIILTKNMQLTRLAIANDNFLEAFWRASSLDSIFTELEKYKTSSLAQVFKAGYMELQKIADSKLHRNEQGSMELSGLDNISRSLRKASDNEISHIEARASFLATVGSTSPFIGLFGTVWGIMSAFQNIGNTGAASLAVVAPGISEALITTAVGLAAAIPAVMAYNFFITKFKKQDLEISNFSNDFLNVVKRNFFKD
jgi:biopolymer transport protein TolQ